MLLYICNRNMAFMQILFMKTPHWDYMYVYKYKLVVSRDKAFIHEQGLKLIAMRAEGEVV